MLSVPVSRSKCIKFIWHLEVGTAQTHPSLLLDGHCTCHHLRSVAICASAFLPPCFTQHCIWIGPYVLPQAPLKVCTHVRVGPEMTTGIVVANGTNLSPLVSRAKHAWSVKRTKCLDATSPRDTSQQLALHVCTSFSLYTGFARPLYTTLPLQMPTMHYWTCRRISPDGHEEMLYCSGSPAPLTALLECMMKSAALHCSSVHDRILQWSDSDAQRILSLYR